MSVASSAASEVFFNRDLVWSPRRGPLHIANLGADRDQLPHQIAKTTVLGDLLAGVLDGHSLGDNASHRFAFDRMGQRITRSVTGRILLRTMAGRLATLAETLDQRPRTHIANFYQPCLQLLTLHLQNLKLRRVDMGISSLTAL